MALSKITGLTAVAALAATVALASPAQAGTGNGIVEAGEFGLYYSQGSNGSWVFDTWGDADLRNNVFPGTNVRVDNNTASYRNRVAYTYYYVFTGINGTGYMGQIPPGYVGNASATYRNTISSIEASPGMDTP